MTRNTFHDDGKSSRKTKPDKQRGRGIKRDRAYLALAITPNCRSCKNIPHQSKATLYAYEERIRRLSTGEYSRNTSDIISSIESNVKCKGCKTASFYGKYGRKYTLSSRAQEVLSTVLEDMIEETLEDARKLAKGTGKNKVAIEDVEMAMVNLCQRLHPQSNSDMDDIPLEYDSPHNSEHRRQNPLKNSDSNQSVK